MHWIAAILGLGLIAAPFAAGYSGDPTGLWWSVLLGLAVLLVAGYSAASWREEGPGYLAFVVGLIVVMTPTFPGLEGKTTAGWAHLLLGGVLTLIGVYRISIR